MAFKFRVVHVKGDDNISDYLSRERHPIPSIASIAEQHVNNVIYHATPGKLSMTLRCKVCYLRCRAETGDRPLTTDRRDPITM